VGGIFLYKIVRQVLNSVRIVIALRGGEVMKRFLCVVLLSVLLLSVFVGSFSVIEAGVSSTAIYIRADGSVDPVSAPVQRDCDVYSLVGDVFSVVGGAEVVAKPNFGQVSLNQSFYVDVNIGRVDPPGVFGFESKLYYNNSVLEVLSVEFPPWHFLDGGLVFSVKNQTLGYVYFGAVLLGSETGRTGSGILARIHFRSVRVGVSNLDLRDTKLLDYECNTIAVDVVSSSVSVVSGYNLTVFVLNSSGLPVSSALVEVGGVSATTDLYGVASFVVSFGVYNVSASHPDYLSAAWVVSVEEHKNITLTLEYPYIFGGRIPESAIMVEALDKGYNISVFNHFEHSPMDVFFEWTFMGTILPGDWRFFSFDHLPVLVVAAASEGSYDFPEALYEYLAPIELVSTSGLEGVFLAEDVPYLAASIFVAPDPPVYGGNTTIGVTLRNPYEYRINISRIDFQLSGLTVGGYFTSIGCLSDVSLEANETRMFSINWLANVGGHHCVKVVLSYSPTTQAIQRNIDVQRNRIPGERGEVRFSLKNPYETSRKMTIRIREERLPSSWRIQIVINGRIYDTAQEIEFYMAAGEEFNVILRIFSDSTVPSIAVIDVEGYIDGKLVGGIRKTMQTTVPRITVQGIGGWPLAFEGNDILVSGTGWLPPEEGVGKASYVTMCVGYICGGSVSQKLADLGVAQVDENGEFIARFPVPNLGIMPRGVFVIAQGKYDQFASEYMIYLGDWQAEEQVGKCILSGVSGPLAPLFYDLLAGLVGDTSLEEFTIDMLIAIIEKMEWIPGFGCFYTIAALVSPEQHCLDLLIETPDGFIGTTGTGEYVNMVNCSWASGNNFNDTQLIVMPFYKGFNIIVDAKRAVYEIESYNMTVSFACTVTNKTAFAHLYGSVHKGTRVVYRVCLEDWVVIVTQIEEFIVKSCDQFGNEKHLFGPHEDVYIAGSNFCPSKTYDLYVVNDVTWVDGMFITHRVLGTVTTVTTDELGGVSPTVVWSAPLEPGKYDFIIDVNHNGRYDVGLDVLYDCRIEATSGFLVIPEFWFGTLLGLIGHLIAFGIFYGVRRRRKLLKAENPKVFL